MSTFPPHTPSLADDAVILGVSSSGNFNFTVAPYASFGQTVLSQFGGYGAFSNLDVEVDPSGDTEVGMIVLSGSSGTLTIALTFTDSGPITPSGSATGIGTWTATDGTGAYSEPNGSGTFGLSTLLTDTNAASAPSFTVITGQISAP